MGEWVWSQLWPGSYRLPMDISQQLSILGFKSHVIAKIRIELRLQKCRQHTFRCIVANNWDYTI